MPKNNNGTGPPRVMLVAWNAFTQSRWRVACILKERYCCEMHVVAPPYAVTELGYDSSGMFTPASVGLEETPSWVHLVPLRDSSRHAQGFERKPLLEAFHLVSPNIVWVHSEPLNHVAMQFQALSFRHRFDLYQAVIENIQLEDSVGFLKLCPDSMRWRMKHLCRIGWVDGVRRMIDRCLLSRVTGFLGAGMPSVMRVRELFHVSEDRLHVSYLPNTDMGNDVIRTCNVDQFRIGFVGRICSSKGIETFLGALQHLPETCVGVVAGTGEEKIIDRLQNYERIRYLGVVSSIAEVLGEIDVLVLPSLTTTLWSEQFGRVLAEAMSAGVVVIGSDSGAIPDVIGDTGLIFREGDVAGLVDRVMSVAENQSLRESLAQKGRARFGECFSCEAHARKLADVFGLERKCVAHKGHKPSRL